MDSTTTNVTLEELLNMPKASVSQYAKGDDEKYLPYTVLMKLP